jgi:glycosyltransferase involved in cell wall biosynthesis
MGRAGAYSRALYRLLRSEGPQVIFAVGVKAALLSVPAARIAGIPLVWNKVDFSYERWLTGSLARACTGVITPSHAVAAAVPEGRLIGVVPAPIRLPEGFRVTEPRPAATLGSIGRLVPYKGHEHVIEAAADLAPRYPDLLVLVAGAAPAGFDDYPRRLRERARELGISERVELLGHVEQIEDVYERLTVAIGATYRDEQGLGNEALGIAVAEASWAGLPVVATRAGGTAEVVNDGVTGTLVPPGDRSALVSAIAPYLDDPALARTVGGAGSEHARARFMPGPVTERLFGLLAGTADVR